MTTNPESWADLPTSKNAALRAGSPLFFTGKPCKHGHVAPRYTRSHGSCSVCHYGCTERWRKAHPNEYAEQKRRTYARHREALRDKRRGRERDAAKWRELVERSEGKPALAAAIRAVEMELPA